MHNAVTEDEDLGLTCPLGPGLNTRCPCATVYYTLLDTNGQTHNLFEIHTSSGQIRLKPGAKLIPGSRYKLKIVASSEYKTKACVLMLFEIWKCGFWQTKSQFLNVQYN